MVVPFLLCKYKQFHCGRAPLFLLLSATMTALTPPITPLRGPVPLAHLLLPTLLHSGNRVVDATCGNGHDTLLLAQLVGDSGHVWGFDIQEPAIRETSRRVNEAGLHERVTLLHCGHQELNSHVAAPLHAVLFNLGYLPGSDRTIITRPDSTLAALTQALALLAPGGIIMVTIYPGHDGGSSEQQQVEAWAAAHEPRSCHCWRMGQINVSASAPYLLLIQKGL